MKIDSKMLGISIWLLALINLVVSIISVVLYGYGSGVWALLSNIVFPILGMILMLVLGFTAYRGVNDKLTLIVVVVFAILNLSIAMGVLVVLLLIRRFAKNETFTHKLWFLPGVVAAILVVISMIRIELFSGYYLTYVILFIIANLSAILLYFILGYWLLKLLKSAENTSIDAHRAYYEDLLARGVISHEEYDTKIAALSQQNKKGE